MKYVGEAEFKKLEEEDKAEVVPISDDAKAIIDTIKEGLERLRISTLLR